MEPLAAIYPVAAPAGTYRTAPTWFHVGNEHKGIVILMTGDMAATSTLDMALLQAQDANGTGAKAFKAITQLTAAGGDEHDKVAINWKNDELDAANDFDHLCVRVRVGTAAVCFSVIVESDSPRHAPVSQAGWTEVIA